LPNQEGVKARNYKGNPIAPFMAKKNGKYSRSRRGKLQPAQMNLSFTAVGNGTNYIDTSLAASIANRRFYNQGLNWSVAGFTVTVTGSTTDRGSVTVCKIPTTWPAYNAWKKGKAMFDMMNEQVLQEEGSEIQGKYHDFKIYLDEQMATGSQLQTSITGPANGDILLPTDCMYNLPTTGEWDFSEFQIPNEGGTPGNTVGYKIHMLGASAAGSKGLISGYGQSRSRPQEADPNVPVTSARDFYNDLFDVGDNHEEIRTELVNDNDEPPYPVGADNSAFEYYPGGEFQLPSTEVVGYGVFNSPAGAVGSITAQRTIKGGNFPCGLIEIKSALPGITFYDIIVHLVPGTHRGYLAEPMEDC